MSGKIDIFVINETKLDSSFPTEQFHIPGFSLRIGWIETEMEEEL